MKNDELVAVYEGLTALDAQLLADRLNQAGIESFVEQTDSPMDSLVIGRQGKIVRVYKKDQIQAQAMVKEFERDGNEGVHGDEGEREETGLEFSTEQRPRDDSPSNDVEGGGVERLSMDRPGAEAPEVEGMQIEEPGRRSRDAGGERIRGFGADRDLAEDADIDRPEIEDQDIDTLDTARVVHERDVGRASANLRPPRRTEQSRAAGEPTEGNRPSKSGDAEDR